MPYLITGAAGMIGRKLTQRLADGKLHGQPIESLRCSMSCRPRRALWRSDRHQGRRLVAAGQAATAVAQRPDMIFHLAGVVSGEAELDFEKGYRVNLDGMRALLEAIRARGDGYRPQACLHVLDCGVRRAVSRLYSR